MASSSVILFKTGFSFISTQVTLGSDSSKAAGKEGKQKTELWSAAVSWMGAGKKYVDVVTKKGKLTIRNPKATSIKCEIVHALRVSLILFALLTLK